MLDDHSSKAQHDAYPGCGTVLRDRFVLEEELDHGRFGTVYKAVDLTRAGSDAAHHHVSLLVLPAEAARNGVLDAFKRELGRLQSLHHPNIIEVLDFDRDGAVHFVTLEYVDGESLRSIVDSLRPELLWEREAVAVVRAIGDALLYAHARGVVHGDVRLENVIVTAQHDVKVLFTSACIAGSAPFSVEACDDVRGLAGIAYELLAGEPPFLRPALTGPQGPAEPKRIKSLSRRQWKVLRGILLGRGDETDGVAELLEVLHTVGAAPEAVAHDEPRPARSTAWRWVAAAWIVVLLGTAYVLTSGAPDEPADAPAAALDVGEPEAAAPSPATASSPAPTLVPVAASAPPPTVDGRVPPSDSAAVALEPRATGPLAAVNAAAAASADGAGSSILTFAKSSWTVAESEGAASLEIRRTGVLDQTVRVVWWISEGTAQRSDDFADVGYVTETFGPGEQSRRILIPIVSDRLAEGREEFRVHLREGSASAGAPRLGAITQATVTVVDDDS
jgi:hypothetical protein